MLTKEALEHLQAHSASYSLNESCKLHGPETMPCAVALPDGVKVQDLEQYLPGRRAARGQLETTSLTDYADYIVVRTELGEARTIYIDSKSAVCWLDEHSKGSEQGHHRYKAQLKWQHTPLMRALLEGDGKAWGQRELAEWINDWAGQTNIEAAQESDTDAGVIERLPINLAIAAIRDIKVTATAEGQSTEQNLRAQRGILETVKVGSKVPTHLGFIGVLPLEHLTPRNITLRVSTVATPGMPAKFVTRIVTKDAVLEQIDRDNREALKSALEGKNGIYNLVLGTFDPR